VLLWVEGLKNTAPYERTDVDAATVALGSLEGTSCTATSLREMKVAVARQVHAVLRRDDLLGLFDTAPDLSGNDIDIAPFIRVTEELDLQMAWRPLDGMRPGTEEPTPTAAEMCSIPVGREFRDWARQGALWRLDHLGRREHRWVELRPQDLRPGIVLLADSRAGGYSPALGWDPTLAGPVAEVEDHAPTGLVEAEEGLGDDAVTYATGTWVPLRDHLRDVEVEVRSMLAALEPPGLGPEIREAAAVAGRLHDVGKAHPVFQDTMERSAPQQDRPSRSAGGPWAKSGGPHRPRHSPPFFRHELASALALLGDADVALRGVAEPELVVYLVAAHHGRVRLGIRSVPEEEQTGRVLGIQDGDQLPAILIPGGELPFSRLSLATVQLGRGAKGGRSWAERSLALLAREDLGPFRLSYLEAIVRLADWRASAAAEVRP
jgi:CRISPR-associated endonuclease/helicase Cas3